MIVFAPLPGLNGTHEPEAAPSLLRYLGELVGAAEPGPPEAVFGELARHFAAGAAGVAYPSRPSTATERAGGSLDRPVDFPWHDQPACLPALRCAAEPTAVNDAEASWLLWCAPNSAPDDPAVLWLCTADARRWSESDKACLALAGQILWRIGLMSGGTPCRAESSAELDARLHEASHVASRLSHDFGNLLTSVLGFSELALNQVGQDTLAHRYINEVWDVARGGAEWLKKLNFFCRRNPATFTPASLASALAEEEARLGAQKSAPWHADVPADLPALACDYESLRQALRQVLDNAREATTDRGMVSVTARAVEFDRVQTQAFLGSPPAGRFVEIVVTDAGPGLSAEVRDRLWRDLFMSGKPRHRGLGLMMTYGIVRCFGGGLRIGSGSAGGTEVRLLFPAAAAAENAGAVAVRTGWTRPAAR
jgi:signal transduction histidine kinase